MTLAPPLRVLLLEDDPGDADLIQALVALLIPATLTLRRLPLLQI